VTKAILLDLGNVIVGLDFEKAYRAAAALCPYSEAEVPAIIEAERLAEPYECGLISTRVFYERFTRALKMNAGYERFCRIWEDMFQPEPLLAEPFLEGLARRRKLILLSNTNELHFESIRARYPALAHFHDFVLSYEAGVMKPEPEIYEEAVRRAGCLPEECFFTDDKQVNVAGALRAALDAVRFTGAAALERELAFRGIESQPRPPWRPGI